MEKNMFAFDPAHRTYETRWATYWIMTDYGWREFQVPYQAITGWKRPAIKEAA